MAGYVYILASKRNGTIYVGCTTDLTKRMYEHRNGLSRGFTRQYGVKRLVYVETYHDVSDAIVRERRMKDWRRTWKIRLIEQDNPFWDDLAVSLLGFDPLVIPAKAGTHETASRDEARASSHALNGPGSWVPAFAGMTPWVRARPSVPNRGPRAPNRGRAD